MNIEDYLASTVEENDCKEHRVYHVWLEGYSVTGMYAPDMFLGSYEAKSFREACMKAMKDNDFADEDIKTHYDKDRNLFWGCRFYEQPQYSKPRYYE